MGDMPEVQPRPTTGNSLIALSASYHFIMSMSWAMTVFRCR